MAKRSGLGQRGLDVLIPNGSFQNQERENVKKQMQPKSSASDKKGSAGGRKSARKSDEEQRPAEKQEEFGESAETEAAQAGLKGEVQPKAETTVDINLVEPNREQPRRSFDEDSLQELSDSIRIHGIIQPLVVQKRDDYYEIIAGERRWRAAKIAGLKEIPVVIRDYSDREIMEISLIENIQREDLNPIEEASAYRRLIDEYSLKQDEVAERVSKSRTAITNSLRLLKLDSRVQEMVKEEMLTSGHVRALLGISDPDLQYQAAQKAFDEKMSVRDVERYVKKLQKPETGRKSEPLSEQLRIIYSDMEEKMKSTMGTKVSIQSKAPGRGRVMIEYYSDEDLERICSTILNGSPSGKV